MKPVASLSLDADNQWSYEMIRGEPDWESAPSYLGRMAPRVLELLDARDVFITFFLIGRDAETDADAFASLAAAGHEIGNHSYSHPIYLYRSPGETRRQLERAQRVITDVTGVTPKFARPPCGVRTPAYFRAAQHFGLRTVQWDVAGFDWKTRNANQIAHEVLRRVVPGSIILLHDGDNEGKQDRRETVVALPLIIEGLRARGLKVVPLTEMLMESEVELAA